MNAELDAANRDEVVNEVSKWGVGLGIVGVALAPLSLPIVLLTLVTLALLALPLVILGLLAIPLAVARYLVAGMRARTVYAEQSGSPATQVEVEAEAR